MRKGVVRSNQTGRHPIVLHLDLHDFAAFDSSYGRSWIVRIKGKRAISAAQIGRAHAGKGLALGSDRRKIGRNPVHIIGHPMFVKKLPESLPLPQLLRGTAAQRNHPTANVKAVLRPFHPGRGKIKLKSLRIAVNKIEDSVSAGVHSRDQVRPRHRALRRDAAGQTPERSLFRQAGKIRHLALVHELRE